MDWPTFFHKCMIVRTPRIFVLRAAIVLWIIVSGAGVVEHSPTSSFHGFQITYITTYSIAIVALSFADIFITKTMGKHGTFTMFVFQCCIFPQIAEKLPHTLLGMPHTLVPGDPLLTIGCGHTHKGISTRISITNHLHVPQP